MLARGELQTIGATTIDEYRKHLEKDAALERRFQPITVEEPSVAHTIEILKGLRDRYEAHHRVTITDDALVAAGNLADRYISDRFLPDKAIDLIDEAGSRLRIRRLTAPPDLQDLEEEAGKIRKAKEAAIDEQDFEKAANLRDQEKKVLERKANREREWKSDGMDSVLTLDEEDIAEVLSNWTGIPVFKLTEEETAKLLRMEAELHKRVIGQEDAIAAVSRSIRRTRSGLKDPKRPSGSFIFLGPSGVGKTELAKTLAEFLFGDEDALIHLDMSEYMEKHTVSRLIGSPPGYVGYEEGGQLTEAVRRRPFSVVLFDEVEKAHPDVFNALLQILEDGRLTDAQGKQVDFKNTVLIMTSNLGTRNLGAQALGFAAKDDAKDTYTRMKEQVDEELKRHFRPEFLNRIDETIVFHQLTREQVKTIVDLLMKRVKEQMKSKDLDIELTEDAKAWLADKGYDAALGARPLRRTIQREIEDVLSEKILMGDFHAGQLIVADVEDDAIVFRAVDAPPDIPRSSWQVPPAKIAGKETSANTAEYRLRRPSTRGRPAAKRPPPLGKRRRIRLGRPTRATGPDVRRRTRCLHRVFAFPPAAGWVHDRVEPRSRGWRRGHALSGVVAGLFLGAAMRFPAQRELFADDLRESAILAGLLDRYGCCYEVAAPGTSRALLQEDELDASKDAVTPGAVPWPWTRWTSRCVASSSSPSQPC